MLTVIRTFNVQSWKRKEVFAHVAKLAAHIPGKYGGRDAKVLRNVTGPSNQVHIISNWESLAAWEEAQKKIAQDSELQELVAEGKELLLYATVTLYESVS